MKATMINPKITAFFVTAAFASVAYAQQQQQAPTPEQYQQEIVRLRTVVADLQQQIGEKSTQLADVRTQANTALAILQKQIEDAKPKK